MERLIKLLSVDISKMSQSYKDRPGSDPPPFPYTAVASHAWKQDADRQLFAPIELSQHCVHCFVPPCTRESLSDHLCLRAQDSTVIPEPAVPQERSAPPGVTRQTTASAPSSDASISSQHCLRFLEQKNGQGATTNGTQGVKS